MWHHIFVSRSAFGINKHRWLRLTINQVSVALIVSADACMQGVQGSNPTDMTIRRSTAFSLWNLTWPWRAPESVLAQLFRLYIVNNLNSIQKLFNLASFAFNGTPVNTNNVASTYKCSFLGLLAHVSGWHLGNLSFPAVRVINLQWRRDKQKWLWLLVIV